jgi:hypothetical protein
MAKTFTKGDTVHHIASWDGQKRIYTYRKAIVHSCGKKQMVLTDAETGQEMGRHFKPDGWDSYTTELIDGTWQRGPNSVMLQGTFAGLTDEEAEAKALEMAQAARANDLAIYQRRLSLAAFDEADTRKEIARLEALTPSAKSYAEAYAEMLARVAARKS